VIAAKLKQKTGILFFFSSEFDNLIDAHVFCCMCLNSEFCSFICREKKIDKRHLFVETRVAY